MSDYPECERLKAVSGESQKIGEFLDWMASEGIVRAVWDSSIECRASEGPVILDVGGLFPERKWQCRGGRYVGHPKSNKPGEDGGECETCGGTGVIERSEPILVQSSESIERLLARYYQIDMEKVDDERRLMLERLREGRDA